MKTTGPVVILLYLVAACTDSASAPTTSELATHSSIAQLREPTEPSPEGTPQELQQESGLYGLRADVGWALGYAYTGVEFDYFATNWVATAVVSGPKPGTPGRWSEETILPQYGHVLEYAPSVSMPQCEGTITGAVTGAVWNQFLVNTSMMRWSEKSGTASGTHSCPVKSAPPPSGGGGGDEDNRVCYTIEIDYYLYDPNTGEITYLGTETIQHCTKPGEYAT